MLLRSRALLLPLVASPLLERERANLLGVWKRKHSGQAGMWNCARPAKLAILVALGALSVSRVLAAEESPPLQLADLLLLGAGGAGGYAPPTLNTPYLVGLGDSRTANAGGVVYPAGIQFSTNVEFDGAYIAQLYALSGTKFLPHTQYNYGVAGQSSAGIAGRLTKTGNDCNYPGLSITAACSTALFGTVSSGGSLGTSTVAFVRSAYRQRLGGRICAGDWQLCHKRLGYRFDGGYDPFRDYTDGSSIVTLYITNAQQ